MPDAPGLGVDIDEDFVAQFPSEANVSIPVSEASGSYVEGTFGERLYVQTRLKRGVYFPSEAASSEAAKPLAHGTSLPFETRTPAGPRFTAGNRTDSTGPSP